MTTADACLPCATHGRTRAATPGYRTCDACNGDIRDDLATIRDRWLQLAGDPLSSLPVTGEGGTRTVPASKSPANDHIIALTDPRSMPLAALGSWARMVSEDTGQRIDDVTVPGLVGYLVGLHAHITRQPWVDDYAAELHTLAYALRLVTPDPTTGLVETKPRPVGDCPNVIVEGHDEQPDVTCGTELFAPLHGDTIRCGGCRRQWTRPEWLRLGMLLEDA